MIFIVFDEPPLSVMENVVCPLLIGTTATKETDEVTSSPPVSADE
jgi:hypothetical protein